jgi:hypothetical protein
MATIEGFNIKDKTGKSYFLSVEEAKNLSSNFLGQELNHFLSRLVGTRYFSSLTITFQNSERFGCLEMDIFYESHQGVPFNPAEANDFYIGRTRIPVEFVYKEIEKLKIDNNSKDTIEIFDFDGVITHGKIPIDDNSVIVTGRCFS